MEDVENWIETATYIVYKDGAVTIGVNGTTGIEEFRSTNSADVMNSCLDAMGDQAVHGGTLFIKKDAYLLTETVTVPTDCDGLRITGEGTGWFDLTGGTLLYSTADIDLILDLQGGICCVDHIGFDGGLVTDDIIHCNAWDQQIHHCGIARAKSYGIKIYGNMQNYWIYNNWIEWNNYTGINSSANKDLFILNNIFSDNVEREIDQSTDIENMVIDGNRFGQTNAGIISGPDDDVVHSKIINNHFRGIGDTDGAGAFQDVCIQLNGAVGQTIIANNTCHAKNNAGVAKTDEFMIMPGGKVYTDVVIKDNYCTDLNNAFIVDNAQTGYTAIRNTGWEMINEGVSPANVADGGTIAHGLHTTPTAAVVTGSVTGDIISVSALGAANITLAIKDEGGGAGTAQIIYWRAWV